MEKICNMKDGEFYNSLKSIVIPMAFQNVISYLVQMVSTLMTGTLGDIAISAVSLANQPYNIFNALLLGFTGGGAVLISQYWGKGEKKKIRSVMALMMWITLIVTIIYCLICYFFSTQIISIFTSEIEVIQCGAEYLKILVFSYLFNGISFTYLAGLRAIENVKFATRIFSLTFIVNVVFNYLLIFGKFGFPQMGLIGAAVGTIIARIIECLICFWYSTYKEKNMRFTILDMTKIDFSILPSFSKLSVPVIFHELNWSLATSAQVAIIGNLSSIFVTAESIALIAQQLGTLFLHGISSASSIMIGKIVGQGNIEEVKRISKKFLKISFFAGILSCFIILLIRKPLLLLYPNISVESKNLAYQIMGILAFIVISISIEYTCTIGILRGAGDTNFAFLADCGCMWFIGIPLGYAAAYIWDFPFVLVFLLLKIDSVAKIIICLIRILRGNYIKDVTK